MQPPPRRRGKGERPLLRRRSSFAVVMAASKVEAETERATVGEAAAEVRVAEAMVAATVAVATGAAPAAGAMEAGMQAAGDAWADAMVTAPVSFTRRTARMSSSSSIIKASITGTRDPSVAG